MRVSSAERILQRSPAVWLRREAWGGVALHRATGDRLELDAEAFAVLVALGSARSLRSLAATLRGQGVQGRLPEVAWFVQHLQHAGFVDLVELNSPTLANDPLAEAYPAEVAEDLRAPLVVHWAVTYRCDLQCPSCYSHSGPRRRDDASPAIRRRLVCRLAKWGVLEVALGGGEPTLLRDFPDLLAAIREAGMVPNVTTNGTVLRAAVIRALAEHAGVVHLSADRPELLDGDRGGVFDRLSRTARQLRAAGACVGANLLLTPGNVGNIRRSLDALIGLGVGEATFIRPKGSGAARHWPGFPDNHHLQVLARDLQVYLAGRPPLRLYVDTSLRGPWAAWGLFDDPEPEVCGCGGGQRHVALTPGGEVYACSHARQPEFRLGNLLTDRLPDLWSRGPGWLARDRYRAACQGVTCPCSRDPRRQ
jgi:radical SAM protein with 4Fe4S-binding SPASM domain